MTDELIYRRVFRAPRELVWRCLTEPAELARFWGPRGMTTPVAGIVVELRPGGRFETHMVGEHGSHRMIATFTEVHPPERLAWVEPASGMHTTSTLEDRGDGSTTVVIHQRHVPEAMRTPQARAGFATSLDKLDEHLTRLAVARTYGGLADLLEAGLPAGGGTAGLPAGGETVGSAVVAAAGAAVWDAPSLCAKWTVRHVVAHVTMPVRLTPERFGAEMAAAGGDFTVLSDTVAERDAALPAADLLAQLRSPRLHGWLPPGGGTAGALSHAVIHSLDVTLALGVPAVAPVEAVLAVAGELVEADGALFGVDLAGRRLEATDTRWSWGAGERLMRADSGALVAFLAGRTLPAR